MNERNLNPPTPSELELRLLDQVSVWQRELQMLLPTLPTTINHEFDDDYLSPNFITGGAAWNADTIKLAVDPGFDPANADHVDELKATYGHECYHLSRGFSFATTPHDMPAIDLAIEEGLATRFETIYAGNNPGYAQYEDAETMRDWINEVKELPDGFDYDWERYKFFDADTGRRWILYKVGTFIVDEAIRQSQNNDLSELDSLSAQEILTLSGFR